MKISEYIQSINAYCLSDKEKSIYRDFYFDGTEPSSESAVKIHAKKHDYFVLTSEEISDEDKMTYFKDNCMDKYKDQLSLEKTPYEVIIEHLKLMPEEDRKQYCQRLFDHILKSL